MTDLKKTPLNAAHRALGAKMVDFGGWDMPVQYPAGIIAEHQAVRTQAGLFDVSHMGELRVKGLDALRFLDWLTPNAVAKLEVGQIHYTGFLTERGTFVDDLLIYREAGDDFLLVVNAGNIAKDFAWVKEKAKGFEAAVTDESDATGQIALQGPEAEAILQGLTDLKLVDIAYYFFKRGTVAGLPCLVSRTGYTGEDGFEIYCRAEDSEAVWNALLAAGKDKGLIPAGLGCRNTLRLESKMALYGHEIGDEIHALEAGLGWTVKFDKGDFLGREALQQAKDAGLPRRLVGFRTLEKRDIARDGMPVVKDGSRVGFVTSGAPSPTLGQNIGLALVPTVDATAGTRIFIEIRGKAAEAEVIPTPFYKRK
ncbi:MAG TPA: glycine cleavage system aminomethyltransferase GcvT [Holophagaceae bacterium]|jgi:aminomethyltransferase|nr:glycine cleavage system aminomethyltransferase GcvT [Holophagaceae bacterium]